MVYNVEFYELSIETGMEEYIALGPLQMVVQIVQGETSVTGLLNTSGHHFSCLRLVQLHWIQDFNPMRILSPTVSHNVQCISLNTLPSPAHL